MGTDNTQWNVIDEVSESLQYPIVAFINIDVGYNECSRLLNTVGGKNP